MGLMDILNEVGSVATNPALDTLLGTGLTAAGALMAPRHRGYGPALEAVGQGVSSLANIPRQQAETKILQYQAEQAKANLDNQAAFTKMVPGLLQGTPEGPERTLIQSQLMSPDAAMRAKGLDSLKALKAKPFVTKELATKYGVPPEITGAMSGADNWELYKHMTEQKASDADRQFAAIKQSHPGISDADAWKLQLEMRPEAALPAALAKLNQQNQNALAQITARATQQRITIEERGEKGSGEKAPVKFWDDKSKTMIWGTREEAQGKPAQPPTSAKDWKMEKGGDGYYHRINIVTNEDVPTNVKVPTSTSGEKLVVGDDGYYHRINLATDEDTKLDLKPPKKTATPKITTPEERAKYLADVQTKYNPDKSTYAFGHVNDDGTITYVPTGLIGKKLHDPITVPVPELGALTGGASPTAAPTLGFVAYDPKGVGHRFKGGDPADSKNWEEVR